MSHDSQRLKILRWLAAGNTLTTWQAISKFRCTTASQRVREIRKKDRIPVQSRIVDKGGSRVAQYFIPAAQAARARRMLAAA